MLHITHTEIDFLWMWRVLTWEDRSFCSHSQMILVMTAMQVNFILIKHILTFHFYLNIIFYSKEIADMIYNLTHIVWGNVSQFRQYVYVQTLFYFHCCVDYHTRLFCCDKHVFLQTVNVLLQLIYSIHPQLIQSQEKCSWVPQNS